MSSSPFSNGYRSTSRYPPTELPIASSSGPHVTFGDPTTTPSTSLSWFRKGIDISPGTIITLGPRFRKWEILEKIHEHDRQVAIERSAEYDIPSYATAKLLCCNPDDPEEKAFMRIYLQIPHRKTEIDDADTRSRQAMDLTASELTAYQDLTRKRSPNTPKLLGWKKSKQDRSGLVPGGFVIWLAYEVVPGLRLGHRDGPGPFWALDLAERDLIREVFLKSYK